jgi:hypothetical protein
MGLKEGEIMESYEIVKIGDEFYLIDSEEIYCGLDGSQNILVNGFVLDLKEKQVGRVAHVGGAFNFKATIQFPGDADLHKNRHVTANCRRVLASTDGMRRNLKLPPEVKSSASMLEALKEISEGKGRYNEDQLIHASNAVEDMKELAIKAIELATNENKGT